VIQTPEKTTKNRPFSKTPPLIPTHPLNHDSADKMKKQLHGNNTFTPNHFRVSSQEAQKSKTKAPFPFTKLPFLNQSIGNRQN
jgi:hypothetical protein